MRKTKGKRGMVPRFSFAFARVEGLRYAGFTSWRKGFSPCVAILAFGLFIFFPQGPSS
jgi:hypothetical protein